MRKIYFFNIILLLSILPIFGQGIEITFTKQDSSDWTLPENQDRITDSVWITRKHNQSLFNFAQETGYSGGAGSPVGTLWAGTSTANAQNEDFMSFVEMHGGNPQALINDTISLNLPSSTKYFDVVLLSYSGGNSGGGFSYSRKEVFPTHLWAGTIHPSTFRLNQNYPNPFNPTTNLSYELSADSYVTITVYDLLGNVVSNLVNTNQSSGYKSVQWNATNNQGEPVSAGVYLYKIKAGDFVDTKKMILLK